MKTRRKVFEMNRDELAAVMAVVLPGRKLDELEEAQMQEMILKWLFASGLSMKHEFSLDTDEDGEIFVVMSAKKACECCAKENESSPKSAFNRSPFGSRLAMYHADGDGSVALAVPSPYRATLIPSTSFAMGTTVLVPCQLSLTRSLSFLSGDELDSSPVPRYTNGHLPNHLPERRNSSSSSAMHSTRPQPYTRTKSDTQVNAIHRIHRLEPPTLTKDGRMVSVDLCEPPDYKPPPPPANGNHIGHNGIDRALNERRGQKINPIRTQPGLNRPSPKVKNKEKDPEKEKGFFRSCYREVGTCCLGLCSNFSL